MREYVDEQTLSGGGAAARATARRREEEETLRSIRSALSDLSAQVEQFGKKKQRRKKDKKREPLTYNSRSSREWSLVEDEEEEDEEEEPAEPLDHKANSKSFLGMALGRTPKEREIVEFMNMMKGFMKGSEEGQALPAQRRSAGRQQEGEEASRKPGQRSWAEVVAPEQEKKKKKQESHRKPRGYGPVNGQFVW